MDNTASTSSANQGRRYEFHDRWRITGKFTTQSPLHIGSGQTTTRTGLVKKSGEPCEVQEVTLDYEDRPCIPGTAIKGVLRSWAEVFVRDAADVIKRLFGDAEVKLKTAESGRAEFFTAYFDHLRPIAHHPPYWSATRTTGVLSHVCIDRATGTAEGEKLFFEEYVPAGMVFSVEIVLSGVSAADIAILLAIIEQGATHSTHPYQFGANSTDGWGRVEWTLSNVTCLKKAAISLQSMLASIPFEDCEKVYPVQPAKLMLGEVPHVAFGLKLEFAGPFLVNDASRAKLGDADETDTRTNFTPLRHPDGSVWLPASSLRGALRQRAELILRTLDPASVGPIERLFGETSRASRLTIEEFRQDGPYSERKQDFVAIDRFTGGAADGAKFDAKYADRPILSTRLTLNLKDLEQQDIGLLAWALRDIVNGRVTFGFGAAKGYGWAKGLLEPSAEEWLKKQTCVPSLVSDSADSVPTAPAGNALAATAAVLIEGKLVFQQTKKEGRKRRIVYLKKNGEWTITPMPFDEAHLSPSLAARNEAEVPIHFEWESVNKPFRIRPLGELWNPGGQPIGRAIDPNHFANPYYFLPLKDRRKFPGDLADKTPIDHGRFIPGRLSGTIRVKLTTQTPLLLCDDEKLESEEKGHKTYHMRTQDGTPTGRPLLTSASVRGMLRSAYEAVTNSRLGVFPGKHVRGVEPAEKHGRRLGFRLPAQQGLSTVPVRIVRVGGILAAELLTGTSGNPTKDGKAPPGKPVFAAWCGHYGWTASGLAGLAHRAEVWAYLTPWNYRRVGTPIQFDFWNVEELAPFSPAVPHPPTSLRPAFGNAKPASWGSPGWYHAFLCVTLNNMSGKHDERVFFSSSPMAPIPLTDTHHQQWRELIQNYHDEHRSELENKLVRPPVLKSPRVYSRHISIAPPSVATSELELRENDLCYAEVQNVGGSWKVKALYPVMISRKLYGKSPLKCLPESLWPASVISELSPADRVFGWVSQDSEASGRIAYQGNVRVGPVECGTTNAIESFDPPIALAILGQPKPVQGRFYLGTSTGTAQRPGIEKEQAGYTGANRIRGPKVYPHHTKFVTDRSDPNAEWVRPPDAKGIAGDKQNRSITGWVKPQTTFKFDLHLDNLSRLELGALVWLLSLPEKHFLRLGLGKPLGFGSVSAKIDLAGTVTADGKQWAIYYSQWDSQDPQHEDLIQAKDEFCAAINQANQGLLPAFLKTAAGFDGPIHYPRLPGQNAVSGEHFKWFGENEAKGKLPLPDLGADDCSLPRDPI